MRTVAPSAYVAIQRARKSGCEVCDWKPPVEMSLPVHHVRPTNAGGDNDAHNLICLCPNCHAITHALFGNGMPYVIGRRALIAFLRFRVLGLPPTDDGITESDILIDPTLECGRAGEPAAVAERNERAAWVVDYYLELVLLDPSAFRYWQAIHRDPGHPKKLTLARVTA